MCFFTRSIGEEKVRPFQHLGTLLLKLVLLDGRVSVRPDVHQLIPEQQSYVVVVCWRWRKPLGLGEGVCEGGQEVIQGLLDDAQVELAAWSWLGRPVDASPYHSTQWSARF